MAWNMCVENGVVKYLVMNLFATTAAACTLLQIQQQQHQSDEQNKINQINSATA
jgi:hypothetical protein